jgi:hypothetical protein
MTALLVKLLVLQAIVDWLPCTVCLLVGLAAGFVLGLGWKRKCERVWHGNN